MFCNKYSINLLLTYFFQHKLQDYKYKMEGYFITTTCTEDIANYLQTISIKMETIFCIVPSVIVVLQWH